jgi:ketosteroid isomerase-like protein
LQAPWIFSGSACGLAVIGKEIVPSALSRNNHLPGRASMEINQLEAQQTMLKQKVAQIVLVVITLLITTLQGNAKSPEESPDVQAIRRVLSQQVEAWNRQDLEGFMKGYWHSPELTFYSGSTTVSGWEETLGRYRNRYLTAGNEMGKLEFTDLKIELLGSSAAFVRGRFHLKMAAGDQRGLFTLTFKKFGDGWKIIHDHTSTS